MGVSPRILGDGKNKILMRYGQKIKFECLTWWFGRQNSSRRVVNLSSMHDDVTNDNLKVTSLVKAFNFQ